MNIVILDGHALNPGDNPWDPLAALGTLTVYPRTPADLVVERAREADILVLNKTRITAAVLDELPRLRCIGMLATGYDAVDIEAAGRRGVPVINVEAYGVDSVAQKGFALLLELCRRPGLHDALIREGRWASGPDWCFWETPQVDLAGLTLGLLGCGNIGRRMGELGEAFRMRVLAYSRSGQISQINQTGQTGQTSQINQTGQSSQINQTGRTGQSGPFPCVSLERLFAEADVLSLHCPLNDESRGIVSRERLAAMKPGALIINTARGGLLDEAAVAEALREGRLGGLGADVASVEPITPDNPLLHAPNVILTPHIAAATLTARANITRILAENLRAFLDGRPQSVVNTRYLTQGA